MKKKIQFRWLWFNLWIGAFHDRSRQLWYICPLPTLCFQIGVVKPEVWEIKYRRICPGTVSTPTIPENPDIYEPATVLPEIETYIGTGSSLVPVLQKLQALERQQGYRVEIVGAPSKTL